MNRDTTTSQAGGPAARWTRQSVPGPAAKRTRPLVLVVEDDPHDWEIYGKILWYNGFDVVYAADGSEGLELAREETPDLLLTDLLLPGSTGWSCAGSSSGSPGSPGYR